MPGAFIGALQMSLPFFGGYDGICRLLENVAGSWQEEEDNVQWKWTLC